MFWTKRASLAGTPSGLNTRVRAAAERSPRLKWRQAPRRAPTTVSRRLAQWQGVQKDSFPDAIPEPTGRTLRPPLPPGSHSSLRRSRAGSRRLSPRARSTRNSTSLCIPDPGGKPIFYRFRSRLRNFSISAGDRTSPRAIAMTRFAVPRAENSRLEGIPAVSPGR